MSYNSSITRKPVSYLAVGKKDEARQALKQGAANAEEFGAEHEVLRIQKKMKEF